MRRLFLVVACLLLSPSSPGLAQTPSPEGVSALLARLEEVLRVGDPNGYLPLLSVNADTARAREFASQNIGPQVTRVAIRERDRTDLAGTLPGDGYQILVELLVEYGTRARLATWRLDVRRRGGALEGSPEEWAILDQQQMTSLQGLHRLSINPNKQYTARNLVISAEDFQLTMEAGSVFVAEAETGPTAFVLLGRGEMRFSPTPKVERGQVKLFAGAEEIASPFENALVRMPPFDVDFHLDRSALTERPVDVRELRRAEDVFRQESSKSLGLDLGDLTPESWSLLPSAGDFLAEVRTRRFDTLTYARSSGEVEDISLFDRRGRKNVSLYSSKSHLARFGRFFDEDAEAEYSVTHYDVDVRFSPSRRSIEGLARLALVTRASHGVSALTIRLADSLAIRSVVSNEFGRLLTVRVRNQNAVIINLPSTLLPGVPVRLTIDYGGVLAPQPLDREVLWPQLPQITDEGYDLPVEESFIYSNRSYWYPQPPTPGYSTASFRVTVPPGYGCVGSGDLASVTVLADASANASLRRYSFTATQPLRYLAFLVTPLVEVRTDRLKLAPVIEPLRAPRLQGAFYDDVDIVTTSNPRLRGRARDLSRTGQDIVRFYSGLVGDCPYPSITLAFVERPLPGGHSPGYVAMVAQPTPGSRLQYRDDPASFPEFPEFFLAHELAHQWWGQAVGWKNYHEQWLSEGFAQYFAALFAERIRGREVFEGMIRRMGRWAREESDLGPVYLGYRIGHVKGDPRLFRAIVYNKGAMVLHMLRLLLGDRAFFSGVRRFYDLWRFQKAGSDDLRRAFEAASGVRLSRFFEQWVYGQDLPQLAFSWRVERNGDGQEAVLRLEQVGDPFDLPVVVTLDYLDKPASQHVLKLNDRLLETRMPLPGGTLRRAEIARDATLVLVR